MYIGNEETGVEMQAVYSWQVLQKLQKSNVAIPQNYLLGQPQPVKLEYLPMQDG